MDMLPIKVRKLLGKYDIVETVHIARKITREKENIISGPRYGAFAVVKTGDGEFVFQKQSYDQIDIMKDNWVVPGGKLEAGESFEEAAIREVWEETGMEIEITDLYKIFHHVNHYVGGSEEWYLAVFHAKLVSESPDHVSSEVMETRRFKELPKNLMGELGRYYRDLK